MADHNRQTDREISVNYKLAQSLDVFRKLIEDGVTDCTHLAEELKVSRAQSRSGRRKQWIRLAQEEGPGIRDHRGDGNEDL